MSAIKGCIFALVLVLNSSQTFAQELVASNTCAQCHSSDGNVMMVSGEDVSPFGGWKASVMAVLKSSYSQKR